MVSVDDPEAFHPESVVATFVLHTKYVGGAGARFFDIVPYFCQKVGL